MLAYSVRVLGPMRSSKLVAVLVALVLIAAACSSDGADAGDGEASATDAATTADTPAADSAAPASETADDAPAEQSAVPETAPAIARGATSVGEVTIDGTSLEYVTSVPEGFNVGDEAPLLLAFPPGGQSLDLTESIVSGTYAAEAERLGWVVVSPAAPDGVRFFDGSEALLPGFVDWIETWVSPEGGAPHVIGISNGGISSFRYAVQNPDRVQSVIVFPGFPRGDDADALEPIADIPFRLYAGETDTSWVSNAERTLELLTELGADVELTVFPGEGHVPSSTRDGTVVFAQLESFR